MPFHHNIYRMFGGGSTPEPDFTMQGVEMGEGEPLVTVEDGRMTVFDWGTDGQTAAPSGTTTVVTDNERSAANWGHQPKDPAYEGTGGTRGKGGPTDAGRSELDLGMSGGQDAPPSGVSRLTGFTNDPKDPGYTGTRGARGKGGATDSSRSAFIDEVDQSGKLRPINLGDPEDNFRAALAKFKGARQTTTQGVQLEDFIEQRAA